MITNTIRLLLKIAAAILLLSAIWVFYTDTTTEAASIMFGKFWFDLSPTSLQVTEAVISRYIDPCGLFVRLGCSPFLWHPVISTTLQWPAVLVLATGRGLIGHADEPPATDATQLEFFEKKIRPVLLQHCYECHSADAKNVKGGLLLDSREAIRKGGDSGASVVPGNIDESLLISALRHDSFEMPPKGKLPDAVIADFVKWVEMGAPDPRDGEVTVNPEIDFEKAREHWAYQPITAPELPSVRQAGWSTNEIDRFTLAKMEELQLQPVELAGKRELIRRATFDLIGLPPSLGEVESNRPCRACQAWRLP